MFSGGPYQAGCLLPLPAGRPGFTPQSWLYPWLIHLYQRDFSITICMDVEDTELSEINQITEANAVSSHSCQLPRKSQKKQVESVATKGSSESRVTVSKNRNSALEADGANDFTTL